MTEKNWKVSPRKFDDLVDQLLFNRGVIGEEIDEETKRRFFKPDFLADLPDPYLMKNIEKAVKRIQQAFENKEKVGIFADYDADGIPGAALVFKAFKKIGLDCTVYIPDRENGYGLSKFGLDYLKKEGCGLVITIDLGIRSLDEALYAKKIGLDLIITDHHLPGDQIPSADLVINPKQKGDKYPYKDLCGCAVGFKLVQGLSKVYQSKLDEKFLKWNLDLVAISTISDVVPLTGENRLLAHFGLIVMQKTKNIGLAELIKLSKIKNDLIGAYSVGFQIGPRINAPGRIDHATKSFDLLVTEDETEAKVMARWLDEKNEERQRLMDQTEKEAVEYALANNLAKNKIVIVKGEWAKGVIGPTASRLVEKFGRPVIIIAADGSKLTGSARSVSGVNIVDILSEATSALTKFGGHAGAAGLSLEAKNWKKFTALIAAAAEEMISESDLIKKIKIDASVQLKDLSKSLFDQVSKFEPFGLGNPRPVFMTENICFEETRFVGRDESHFSAKAVDESNRLKLIHFSFPYDKSMINCDKKFDICYTVNLDEWNGRSELSLHLIDLRLSKS